MAETSVVASIDAQDSGRIIPKSFAGLSREWRRFPFPESGATSEVHPANLRLLAHLCAFDDQALSIRIGGASTEGATSAPGEAVRWAQIAQIFKATQTPLIINIGLARGDAELARNWVRTALATLPKGAVASFELGNEPDGWPGKRKPADHTFEQYLEEFHAIGSQLVPELTSGLAGPAWAHGAPPDMLNAFIAREKPLLNLLTVHSYRFDPKSNPMAERLLADAATSDMARKLAPGIVAAHAAGLKLRLDESGSAWSGGVPSFSDSFAAALFTLDLFFELANAGLDGVNLHSVGTNACSPIKEDVDKNSGQTRAISASAPYYGMLLFAEAVANEARLIHVESSPGPVRVWATRDKVGVVRLIAINRSTADVADVTLRGGNGQASVKRLKAPSPRAIAGITFAGQTFDDSLDGTPIGALTIETVSLAAGALRFPLDAATAALITREPR